MNCKICGKDDSQKAMTFRGEDFCSETHRKQLADIQKNIDPTKPVSSPYFYNF